MGKGMWRKEGCKSLWSMALLAASILSSCFLLIEGQGIITEVPIQVQPEHLTEGNNVTLTPQGNFSAARSCRWFRGQTADPGSQILTYYFPPNPVQNLGREFTHRETVGPDCSLQIRQLTARDTGKYTLTMDGGGISAVGYASIETSENLSSPRLESSPPNGMVAENSDAILICHTSNQPDVSIYWSKDHNLLPVTRGDLSDRNRTLTFPHVSRSDSGIYKCLAKNSISYNESNSIQLRVTYGPDMKLNPEGIVFKRVNTVLFVECLVDSFPRAKLQWFFNGIEQNETGSIFKVWLKDHNNAGPYTCRATNTFTNLTDERTCYVMLRKNDMSAAVIVGIVLGSVFGLAIIADFLYFLFKTFFRARVRPPTESTPPSGEVEETPQAD